MAETVDRGARDILRPRRAITERHDCRFDELNGECESERERMLRASETVMDSPDATLHTIFVQQVAAAPDRIAAATIADAQTAGGRAMTYAQLSQRANSLAEHLNALAAPGARGLVGIIADRRLEMVTGILGILKSGQAYLPIDPQAPTRRIGLLLQDSGASAVLAQRSFLDKVPAGIPVLRLDDEHSPLPGGPAAMAYPQDLAYVIYTSGSTGTPKGVMIEHHSVVNRLRWMQMHYSITADDVVLQKTSYTFDVSVWELLSPGFWGTRLCLLASGAERDPEMIVRAIDREGITIVHFVPSMLNVFLNYVATAGCCRHLKSLRYVFASGEALSSALAARFLRMLTRPNGTRLINLYGPTEATVDVSYFDCPHDETPSRIPIGRPIHNTGLYVMGDGKMRPVGIPGELCISGTGLARGYLNQPGLTALKFGAALSPPGGRLYRTGDLARWLPDGQVDFLGRMDRQLKVRGFRVEPEEIETRLLEFPGIKACAVTTAGANHDSLCAYYVAPAILDPSAMRSFLADMLPSYMCPNWFVRLDEMPIGASGKVDRRALPTPSAPGHPCTEPQNETERKLVTIWAAVLSLDERSIGTTAPFFDMGGNSLNAVLLKAEIRKRLGADVTLDTLLQIPTIRELAQWLARNSSQGLAVIPRAPVRESYPTTAGQKQLFVLSQMDPATEQYHEPLVVRIDGEIQPTRFERAFRQLLARHEVLRTSFLIEHDEVRQRIHQGIDFTLERDEGPLSEMATLFKRFIRPFDLSRPPVFRARLVTLDRNQHLLMLDSHHVVIDGVSLQLLITDVMRLYAGETPPLPGLSYKDFAVWRQTAAHTKGMRKQADFWQRQFQGGPLELEMPCDSPRTGPRKAAVDVLEFGTGRQLAERIRTLAALEQATTYMVLLAAYNVLLHHHTGQTDITVGTPASGRMHPQLEDIVGMFLNILPMRNRPEADKPFAHFLGEVKSNSIRACDNDLYHYSELVQALRLTRKPGRNFLFDTMLGYHSVDVSHIKVPNLEIAVERCDLQRSATLDMILEARDSAEGITFALEYNASLFQRSTAERFSRNLLTILDNATARPSALIRDCCPC